MFKLAHDAIGESILKEKLIDPKAGGFVSFQGWVRNQNDGKDVISLEYEAYEVLAEKEALKIIHEAKEKFDILNIFCVHRVGKLEIGEMAVWIGVSSVHREPAFGACQYMIDELKRRVPIWKKEYYVDGNSGWVHCNACSYPEKKQYERV